MNFLQKQLEDPVRFARIRRWFFGGLAAAALAEIVLPRIFDGGESHFAFEDVPAWFTVRVHFLCGDYRGFQTRWKAVAHAP